MKRSKYRAQPTTVDGHRFASKKEAHRYIALKAIQSTGDITGLRLQVPYNLTCNGVHICRYIADFVYQLPDGEEVVEDTKGFKTEVYRLKKKLMAACYGITIHET